jgi:hypothetical protein
MSNIQSAGVSRRFESLLLAARQAVDQAPLVAGAIAPDLIPELEEGEVLPDYILSQKLISRALVRVSRQLDEADHQRKHVKNIDRHQKKVFEKAAGKLRAALVDVRYVLDRNLDKDEAKQAFEGRSNLARLKTPVIERVSTRLISLLGDPKAGWGEVEDEGHRNTAEAARIRLQNALNQFEQAKEGHLPERNALLSAQGHFERELEEKQKRLRRLLRHLRGLYEGAGFEREAAALVLRRRASPKPSEEQPPKADAGAPKVPAAVVPGSPVAVVPAQPAPAEPAEPAVSTAAELKRKRRRARRRSKKAQQGVAPTVPASAPAEGQGS